MDLVDKSKIKEEKMQDKTSFVKGAGTETINQFGVEEQIKSIRRQLVLAEMGVKVPKNIKGEVDVKALMKVEISKEEDKKMDNETKRMISPLKSINPKDSVITEIEPVFPLFASEGGNNDLKLTDKKQFEKKL